MEKVKCIISYIPGAWSKNVKWEIQDLNRKVMSNGNGWYHYYSSYEDAKAAAIKNGFEIITD